MHVSYFLYAVAVGLPWSPFFVFKELRYGGFATRCCASFTPAAGLSASHDIVVPRTGAVVN